ncbi:MAG: CHAT domain-containing protein [candidate division Zixibacteria bacterium]|nr:CHAT domain-containing protein [candidate division Zixibacteria bacterium]
MICLEDIRELKTKKAVESYIQQHFSGDTDAFAVEVSRTLNSLLHGNLKKAEAFYRSCVKLFSLLPEHTPVLFITMEARLAHWSGNHKKAITKYNSAIRMYQKRRDFAAISKTRQGLMDVFMYLGAYDKALDTGKKALSYFQRTGKQVSAAQVMTNIGNVYHRMDKNKLSMRYYDKAREIFAAKGGVPLAIVDYNRANVLANMNQLDEAEKLYQFAADVYRQNGLELIACKSEYSLAYLHFLSGNYSDALEIFDRVYDTFDKLGDTKAKAVTDLDLAEINIELNQFGTAMMQGERACTVFENLGHTYEQAKSSFFAAEASRKLGDLSHSRKYLSKSEKLFQKEGNRFWKGMIALEKSRLLTAMGESSKAVSAGRLARKSFIGNHDERRRIDADISLIHASYNSGKIKQAIELASKVERGRLTRGQKHDVQFLLGQCYLRRKLPKEALKHFKTAIDAAEKMLSNLSSDEIRFFFAFDKYPTYLSAVECLLAMGKSKEAFLQNSNAMSILNQRIVPDTKLRREVPAELLNRRKELRSALKRLEKKPETAGQRILSTGSEYRKIEYGLWANEQKIRSVFTSGKKERVAINRTSMEIQKNLCNDEQIVNLICLDGRVGAFVSTNRNTRFVKCPLDQQEFRSTLHKLQYLMEREVLSGGRRQDSSGIINFYLAQLYEWLISPLHLSKEQKRVIMLVDGEFAQVPYLALLNSNKKRLKDIFHIRVIANPRDILGKRRNLKFAKKNNSIFAVSDIGLPMILREGKEIAYEYPRAKLYSGKQANSVHLKQVLNRSDGFIHIASHASRASENPLFSRILLHDGPFFPFDLFENGIKAELVSLSGCQTAAPGIYYGNSFSLAKAFYQAGSRFVLASLWSVSDKMSMLFMTQFYKSLKSVDDIGLAYYTAVNQTEKINSNPALWSPFILIGM